MIAIGLNKDQKQDKIHTYIKNNSINNTYVLYNSRRNTGIRINNRSEFIEWDEIIQYKFYYKLLQDIDSNTLIVIDECLRTQDRNCLTYNCVRNFLNQTKHQIIFQHIPIISEPEDFMILFDLDTRSRWKKTSFRDAPLKESNIVVSEVPISFCRTDVITDDNAKVMYAKEKRKLIDNIGLKDPHTIPRNLHLLSGKYKLSLVKKDSNYVGRNNRYCLQNMRSFRDASFPNDCIVFEFCHNFIDFCDFLALSGQTNVECLVSDLKIDIWYLNRYQEWLTKVRNTYETLRNFKC